MNQLAKYISRNMLLRSIAALSILGIAGMTASAQLTLDDFSKSSPPKALKTAQSSVTSYEALPAGSPLGAARETVFQIGPNPYKQSSTLKIGKGICIVEGGFQIATALDIIYGVTLEGVQAPLGLNLGTYSGLQLNFAGIASTESLLVIVQVYPQSGGIYEDEVALQPTDADTILTMPYSSFLADSGAALTQTEASNINYLLIIAEGGGTTDSFGITSFQAVN
ncbi:MAG: hypothetical protein WBQ43_01815 [Terriglobales bacterium]